MSDRSNDELLDGLKLRDFFVLVLRENGENPSSLRHLRTLKRSPLYVRAATSRLVKRGLLARDGDAYVLTDDGRRAMLAGGSIWTLELFEAELFTDTASIRRDQRAADAES